MSSGQYIANDTCVHPGIAAEKNNVDLKCYLCDKEFENSSEFVEHNEKRHPGVHLTN